ncbi:Trypsin-1 [Portunus trituberculatus]|uniref:Trypsin-1 n=1 Tax=Portunus trituberculatus TaxID=210409 RepID=A0A5B7CQJ4_PORTR|nr:Trypsin-1 [Portunus trituberculatus]
MFNTPDVSRVYQESRMVSVQHRGFLGSRHVCGGTILTEQHILTTADCVDDFTVASLSVVAGVVSLEDHGENRQVIQIDAVIPHEDFNVVTHSNNVAILKLKEPLALGDLVQPLSLPPDGEVVPENTLCTVIGWGAIFETGDYYKELQKAEMTTLTDEACRASYGAMAIEDSMMCAGLPSEEVDTCDGDEGGPLLCMGHLHGITSWGQGCLQSYYPRVFTEVACYKSWIMMYISADLS